MPVGDVGKGRGGRLAGATLERTVIQMPPPVLRLRSGEVCERAVAKIVRSNARRPDEEVSVKRSARRAFKGYEPWISRAPTFHYTSLKTVDISNEQPCRACCDDVPQVDRWTFKVGIRRPAVRICTFGPRRGGRKIEKQVPPGRLDVGWDVLTGEAFCFRRRMGGSGCAGNGAGTKQLVFPCG